MPKPKPETENNTVKPLHFKSIPVEIIQDNLRTCRTKLVYMLNSSERDFDKIRQLTDEYISLFVASDILLGYLKVEREGDENV